MAASPAVRRLGRFALGLVLGLVLFALVLFVWMESGRPDRLGQIAFERIGLPAEVLRLEDVSPAGVLRVSARDVLLLDEADDTVAFVPRMVFSLDPGVLGEDGPIVLSDVVLQRPYLNLVEFSDGTRNLDQVTRVTVADQPVDTEPGRAIVFDGVRIERGRVRWVTPWTPDGELPPELAEAVRLTRVAGVPARVRTVRALDASLPMLRFGGAAGWRVEVASASAQLSDPDLRLLALAGVVEQAQDDGIRFDIDVLRTDASRLAGAGVVRFGADGNVYDVELSAQPLAFADLRWFVPQLPAEGVARGEFAIESRAGDRLAVRARDAEVTAFGSRIVGRVAAEFGGDRPAVFRDTRLELAPLRLSTLRQLGILDTLAYDGEVTGVLATRGAVEADEGALTVDLRASLVPRGLDVPPSVILAVGGIGFGGGAPVRFEGIRLTLQPLHLAALRPLVPDQAERLRGVLRGDALLNGTPDAVRITDGTLAYEIPGEAPIRLAGLAVQLDFEPELRFDVRADARPLPLGTLAALVPGLPFERATLTGPIRIAGTTSAFDFDVDLQGSAGGIAARGRVVPGADPLRFEVSGRLAAFQPGALLTGELPVQGPISGTFSASGTTQSLRFNVDLSQALGRFALAGTVRDPTGDIAVDVTGDVYNFQLGALVGQPTLFPSPLTGPIAVRGGGGGPIEFDVGLTGAASAFLLRGWFLRGDVPRYAVSGRVEGLDVGRLPGAGALPPIVLTANLELQGSGSSLQDFAGRLNLQALPGTLVAGYPVETLTARLAVRDGVLVVDTVAAALAGARLDASGSWGLTRVAPGSLNVAFVSQDLTRFAPVLGRLQGLQPVLEGSLAFNGRLGGTLERPFVDGALRGRNLRYEAWRAATLAADIRAQLAPSPDDWQGTVVLTAENARLRGDFRLESIRLEASAAEGIIGVGLLARRDRQTDVVLSAAVELDGRTPQGLLLETFALRLEEMEWRLDVPARIRYTQAEGLVVQELVIRRTDQDGGLIWADGRLPPVGDANIRLQLAQIDLEVLRRLWPDAPELQGVVSLEALVEGPVAAPVVLLSGQADGLRVEGVEADQVVFTARYADRLFVVDSATVVVGGLPIAVARGQLPMSLSLAGLSPSFELLDTAPLQGQVVLDSLPLGLVVAAVPAVSRGEGHLVGELTVGGTVASPTMSGEARVIGGAVRIDPLNVRYTDINGLVTFRGDEVRFDSLGIRSGGTAVASGSIRPSSEGSLVYLTANFNQFRAADSPDLTRLTISGQAALSGRFPAATLTGAIRVDEALIALPNFTPETPLELADFDVGQIGADTIGAPALGPALLAQVRVDGAVISLGDNVWVQNNDLRAQLTAEEVLVYRDPVGFRIFGDVLTQRGTYRLRVGPLIREFDVVSGRIGFVGTTDFNPDLDILASYDIRTGGRREAPGLLTVLVNVSGTVESPRIELSTSTQPPLPQSEILSYLVFGVPTFALGPESGADLAQQVVVGEIVGGLALIRLEDLLRNRSGLPCDQLRVRGRPEFGASSPLGGTTVECSEQIARNVFWTIETGVGVVFGGELVWATSLIWQIDPNLSASVAIEPVRRELFRPGFSPDVQYQFTSELRRIWEFGRPPAQSLFDRVPAQQPGRIAPAPEPPRVPPE